jgi:hypothetical protein
MGSILSLLGKDDLPSDVIMDFDSARPPRRTTAHAPRRQTEIPEPEGDDLDLYNEGNQVIVVAEACVLVLDGYEGCQDLIRQAMANPQNEAIQINTFEGMFPNVERIKTFYVLAKSLDALCERLVLRLIDSGTSNPALLKLFANVLSVALKFDRAKMMHPAIQNDFSQYRRALQKRNGHPGLPVSENEANSVSMFIAQATPIITELSSVLDTLNRNGKDVTKFLADFSHICCAFVMREKSQPKEHAVLALTAMVVAFIMYDNVNPTGVFSKNSLVDVKACVGQIRGLSDVESRGMLVRCWGCAAQRG